ncbi:hypothetical protein GNI_060020 [Gregarina niphandrodes]|uniref:Uncharacterized protein n=1 Tax=Gregarina niphandrodes TaxID=110365 RepID=A0A023B8H3_GRENI|nr:hypothetical protein GNI_060020 [Gregarina niphandrodes]EZG69095.1 hypothetical protein GNI_060020 [Gregarina niphandrodes]|eukprot:XP_011134500.1 hypothetical protein GNI_060020 [Gregarina niphandrodes]
MIASFLGQEPEPNASGTNAGITQAILLLVSLLGYFSLLIVESIKERRKEYEFRRQQIREQLEIAEAEEKETQKDQKPFLFQLPESSVINLTVPAWLNPASDVSARAEGADKVQDIGSGSYSTKASSRGPASGPDPSSADPSSAGLSSAGLSSAGETYMPRPEVGDGPSMKALELKEGKRKILLRRYQYLSSAPGPYPLQITGSQFNVKAGRPSPAFDVALSSGRKKSMEENAVGPRSSPDVLRTGTTALTGASSSGASLLSQMDPATVRRLFVPRPGIRRQVSGVLVPASGGCLRRPRVSVVPEEDEKRASILLVPSPRYCPKVVHDEAVIMLRSSPSLHHDRMRSSSPRISPCRRSARSGVFSGSRVMGKVVPRSAPAHTRRSARSRARLSLLQSSRKELSSKRGLRSKAGLCSKRELKRGLSVKRGRCFGSVADRYRYQISPHSRGGFVPSPAGPAYGKRSRSGASRHRSSQGRSFGSPRDAEERKPSSTETQSPSSCVQSRRNSTPRIAGLEESCPSSQEDLGGHNDCSSEESSFSKECSCSDELSSNEELSPNEELSSIEELSSSEEFSFSQSSLGDVVLNLPGGVPRLWRLDEPWGETEELPVMSFASIFNDECLEDICLVNMV